MKQETKSELRAVLIMLLSKLIEDDSFSQEEQEALCKAVEVLKQDNTSFVEEREEKENLDQIIRSYLRDLGVAANVRGYNYLKTALDLGCKNPLVIEMITKCLYPEIAKLYKTTSSRVERAIRHAIEISWNRGSEELIKEIWGYTISPEKEKPTNSEYIAALAEYIRMQL